MARKKVHFNKFEIPDNFLDMLYEFTGSSEKNKGYILVYIDENGNGGIKQKFDSQATEFALTKFLEIFTNDNSSMHHVEFEESPDENDDDD